MAGLLDFLIGSGLLSQNGIGGPSSMNFGAGDQQIDPGLMAFAQSRAQPVPQPQGAQPQEQADIPQQPQPAQYQQPMPQQQTQNPYNRGLAAGTLITPLRAAMMAPAYQAQLQQAQYNSLGTMGYTPAERIAIMSDPNVALNMLGTHQLGSNKYPNGADIANVQVGRRIGQIPTSDPRLNAMLGAPVKLGDSEVAGIKGPSVWSPQGGFQAAMPGALLSSGPGGVPSVGTPQQGQPGQPQPGQMGQAGPAQGQFAQLQPLIDFGNKVAADKKVQDLNIEQGNKQYAGINAQASQWARDLKPYNDLARSVLSNPNMYSGIGANAVLDWNKVKAAFGGRPDTAALMEGLQKITASNVLGQVNLQKDQLQEAGAQSSRIFSQQVDLVMKAAQSTENTLAGNRILTEVQSRMGQLSEDVAQQAREYRAKHGYLDSGFDQHLADYMTAHPVFTQQERANPMLLAAPSVPPGLERNEQGYNQWKAGMNIQTGQPVRLSDGKLRPSP